MEGLELFQHNIDAGTIYIYIFIYLSILDCEYSLLSKQAGKGSDQEQTSIRTLRERKNPTELSRRTAWTNRSGPGPWTTTTRSGPGPWTAKSGPGPWTTTTRSEPNPWTTRSGPGPWTTKSEPGDRPGTPTSRPNGRIAGESVCPAREPELTATGAFLAHSGEFFAFFQVNSLTKLLEEEQ